MVSIQKISWASQTGNFGCMTKLFNFVVCQSDMGLSALYNSIKRTCIVGTIQHLYLYICASLEATAGLDVVMELLLAPSA